MPKYIPQLGVTKHTELTDKEINGVIDHALRSVRDGHLYNINALKRLLATQPHKALEILKKVWTGATGENYCRALTFDGTYIYAGLDTSPARVIKINPNTMTAVSLWYGGSGEGYCYALTFDGTYIYAGLNTSPARVIKINPNTMAKVSSWTGATGENYCRALTFDGTYIYAGLNTSPAMVIRKIMRDISESGT